MPLYEYICGRGHLTEDLRHVDDRDKARPCMVNLSHKEGEKAPKMPERCLHNMQRKISLTQSYIGSTDRPARGQG